jgi:hypothetical protein
MKESASVTLSSPSGATLDGTSLLWIVDSGRDKAYKYDLTALFSGTGDLNASSQFSLYSENGDAQGL